MGWGVGTVEGSWQAEAADAWGGQGLPAHVPAGSAPAQVESAPSPAPSRPPTLCLRRQHRPQSSWPVSSTRFPRSQLPGPIASPAPGRAEGHLGPGQSWTPLPHQLVCLRSARSQMGVTRRPPHPHSALRLPTLNGSSRPRLPAGAPGGAPGPATCLPALGQSLLIPFLLNHPNTRATTLASLQHAPHPVLWLPSLQFTAEKHTHTHSLTHKTNCGMFPRF